MVKFFLFLGGGLLEMLNFIGWFSEQQLVWLALALWCMISMCPVTIAACITWLILSFPLTPLFSKRSSAIFFSIIFGSAAFFTNKRIIYEWIQTIAKKSFRASQYHGKKGSQEAKLCPVGINWFPVSWDGLVQVLPRQTGYHLGCTNVVVWVMHAARLWLERSLCRVCTFYHTYLSLQSLHI